MLDSRGFFRLQGGEKVYYAELCCQGAMWFTTVCPWKDQPNHRLAPSALKSLNLDWNNSGPWQHIATYLSSNDAIPAHCKSFQINRVHPNAVCLCVFACVVADLCLFSPFNATHTNICDRTCLHVSLLMCVSSAPSGQLTHITCLYVWWLMCVFSVQHQIAYLSLGLLSYTFMLLRLAKEL